MSTPTAADLENGAPKMSNMRLVFRIVLIIAILVAIVQAMGPYWTRVMGWGLEDNDDAMRVLQVRDWLSGQAWFDVSQHRLSPPQGGDMHWSRIADLPLAALMAPLIAIFGADLGAKYAAFFTPVLLGVVYVWLGARTATSLSGKGAFLPGILLVACAPAALSYFLPGRVDHHGLQMMLIIAAMWGLFCGGKIPAALAGLAIATGICIGLEALPLQIVLIGWVAARWGLRGDEVKNQTVGFGLGFCIAILALFALTVPAAKWSLPVNDAVGRGYVVLGSVGGLLLASAAQFFSKTKLVGRLFALVAIGVVVLSGIAVFPEIIIPPYGKVDPLLTRLWLNNVNETAPLIETKLSRLLSFALFPFLAAIGAIVSVIMTEDKERDLWILAAMSIIVAAGLAIFWQSRVAGLATAVSSIIAAAMIAKALERFNWKVALGFAIVVNPVIPGVVGTGIANLFEPSTTRFVTGGGQGCFTQASFQTLSAAKAGLVVAPIDMGARILLTSHHSVLAAPYHRNNKGNLAAYQLFLLPQGQAKSRAATLGADYVAICKKSAEVAILSREGPKGLMSDLQAGTIPDWLIALPTPKGSDVTIYAVKQP
jgi:asparagine N-glycosylation enzyme membrane subunit Stt3